MTGGGVQPKPNLKKKKLIETKEEKGGGVEQNLKCLIYLLLKFHKIFIKYSGRIFTNSVSKM